MVLGLGDRVRAVKLFEESGHHTGGDGPGVLRAACRQLVERDSVGALQSVRGALVEDVMSAECHSLVADLIRS
jgi:hypothetical protein